MQLISPGNPADLGKPPEAGPLEQTDHGGGARAPCLAGPVPLVGDLLGPVAGEVEPPVCSLLSVAASPRNKTLGAMES